MKITDTDTYIALISDAFDKIIVPELRSSTANSTAHIIKAALLELRKRESVTPGILRQHIEEGRALVGKLREHLKDLGGDIEATEFAATYANADATACNFAEQLQWDEELTTLASRLAEALSARRKALPDAAQQQRISALLLEAGKWEQGFYRAERAATVPARTARVEIRRDPLTKEKLETFLRSARPEGKVYSVSHFETVAGGFGKQTYRVTAQDEAGTEASLIVRKSDPVPYVLHGTFVLDTEYELLKDLHAAGLPVARPLCMARGLADVDGDYYVMTALPGKPLGSFLDGAAKIPEPVLRDLARQLATLHALPTSRFPHFTAKTKASATSSATDIYRQHIAGWWDYYHRVEHLPSPFIVYLFDWLEQHLPADMGAPVMVHGDFNIHNVMGDDTKITAVLDWETANFGAPEQDLAWVRPHVSRHMAWDDFVAEYQASGGRKLREDNMKFGFMYMLLTASFPCNKGHLNLLSGAQNDIRYAMMELGFWDEFMTMAMAMTQVS